MDRNPRSSSPGMNYISTGGLLYWLRSIVFESCRGQLFLVLAMLGMIHKFDLFPLRCETAAP